MLRNSDNVFRFINEIIANHMDTHTDDNRSDYVGAYVQHLNNLSEFGTPTTFSLHELAGTVADLFIAGAETTTIALMWSLPLLASHPEVQNRMFEEIQNHVVTERLPSVKDKTNLVYTEAFYMEVLRYTNLVTAGFPHATTQALDFRGFHIPEDTMVFFDTGSVMFDSDLWNDPYQFRPSRFIDETGRLQKSRVEQCIAFSLGKRNCVGESLARMELLMFLSAIVQRYELVCPDDVDLSMNAIDGEFRMVHAPKPYDIIFRKR